MLWNTKYCECIKTLIWEKTHTAFYSKTVPPNEQSRASVRLWGHNYTVTTLSKAIQEVGVSWSKVRADAKTQWAVPAKTNTQEEDV